jgi:hypothetical protein
LVEREENAACGSLLLHKENAMIQAASLSRSDAHREFLMKRGEFDPKEFDVDMSRQEFMDLMVSDFSAIHRGQITIDEMVLHPRIALDFCDQVRKRHDYFYVPDDIILRSLMTMRKRG